MIAQLDLFAAPVARATPPAAPPAAARPAVSSNGGTAAEPPKPELERPAPAPQPAAAAPADEEHSHFWQTGFEARSQGAARRVPGYLLEAYRDTPEKVRLWKQAQWLAGWDAGPAPAPVARDDLAFAAQDLEPDALAALRDYSAKIADDQLRGCYLAHLRACLARKRKDYCSGDSAKDKRKAEQRKLDRTDLRRAYRSVCPRTFAAVAADAWTIVDELDRLCRSPDGDGDRRHALNCALDELFVEANGGDTCGTGVFHGPKRLRKALRVKARAEKRWPMWGVEGRYRFQWRGLTMISSTRWGGIYLDTDRHPIGTLCHSSSGYRSFSGGGGPLGCSPQESSARMLDAFVDATTKNGMGLGGQLERYVPFWIDMYRQALDYHNQATPAYRAECPAMTPAEERPDYWAKHDAKFAVQRAEAERMAAAAGIDLGDFIPALKAKRQGCLL